MQTLAPLRPEGEPRIFRGRHATLRLRRPVPEVVVLQLEGRDVGEFGAAPFRELEQLLTEVAAIEIFVDARTTSSASLAVSAEWAQWLTAHRDRIRRLNILCGSRFIELTAEFVQRFTQFGPRMRIYTEAPAFDEALAGASAR
jgi:hypothetical protein